MFEDFKIRKIINTNKRKNKDYYNQFEKSDKYLVIKKKSDLKYLYLAPKFKGIIIHINHTGIKDIKQIKSIIKLFPNKEIELYEEEKMLKNEDIKEFYKISRKIFINTQYIEKRKYNAKNEIYFCDINTYILIMEKIEFLGNICKKYFKEQDEQVMFIITQLLKYIKYVNYHDYRTCMANAILLGTGVCIDFAITLYKCLEEIGIECELMHGISKGTEEDKISSVNILKRSNHAWNQVKIGDKWYNVDITWMLTLHELKWILTSDKEFTEDLRHITNMKEHYCQESYDRKRVEELYQKYSSYESVLKNFDKGNKEMNLLYKD